MLVLRCAFKHAFAVFVLCCAFKHALAVFVLCCAFKHTLAVFVLRCAFLTLRRVSNGNIAGSGGSVSPAGRIRRQR